MKCIRTGHHLIIFFLIIFSGCAIKSATKNLSDEEVLRERVTAYWSYRIGAELDKCYEYEYPLIRKMQNLVSYIQSFDTATLKWKSFAIKKISMEEDTARVDLALKVRVKLPGITVSEPDAAVTDLWVRHEGQWYHVLNRFREKVLPKH
jgi:hypothetical protein